MTFVCDLNGKVKVFPTSVCTSKKKEFSPKIYWSFCFQSHYRCTIMSNQYSLTRWNVVRKPQFIVILFDFSEPKWANKDYGNGTIFSIHNISTVLSIIFSIWFEIVPLKRQEGGFANICAVYSNCNSHSSIRRLNSINFPFEDCPNVFNWHLMLIGYALTMQIYVIWNRQPQTMFDFIKNQIHPSKLKVDCIAVPHLINWVV